VSKPPKRIWLQWYGQDRDELTKADMNTEPTEVCWCSDKIFDTDLEYVLVDKKAEK